MSSKTIWFVVAVVVIAVGYWYYKKNAGVSNTSSGPLVSVSTATATNSSAIPSEGNASVQPTTTLAV